MVDLVGLVHSGAVTGLLSSLDWVVWDGLVGLVGLVHSNAVTGLLSSLGWGGVGRDGMC